MAAEPSAIPDFSGIIWGKNWPYMEQPVSGPGPIRAKPVTGPLDNGKPVIGNYENPMLTPKASALLKQRGEISLSGAAIPGSVNQCRLEPTPHTVGAQFGMQILQQKDEVTLLYVWDHKVRHVRMNASHPKNVTPTWQGDSVGRYEGDTLVIDTVGQKVGPLSAVDEFGTPFGPALHVVERYRLIDGVAARDAVKKFANIYFPGRSFPISEIYGRGPLDPDPTKKGLQVEITVEDPDMFTTPWSGLVTYLPTTRDYFPEAVCAERSTITGMVPLIPLADKADF